MEWQGTFSMWSFLASQFCGSQAFYFLQEITLVWVVGAVCSMLCKHQVISWHDGSDVWNLVLQINSVWFRFYRQCVFPLSKFTVRWYGICCCSGRATCQKMVQSMQMVKCESTVMVVQFGPPHQGWVWMLRRWRNWFWKTDELQFILI